MVHGEYINDYRCFRNAGRIDRDEALRLVLTSEFCSHDNIEYPENVYLWLNKGWHVVNVSDGGVLAVYLHDGTYYKYRAREIDFIREFKYYPGPKSITSMEEFKQIMQERRDRRRALGA